ncbi:MAG: hypothetical protein ACFFCS_14225 [Candidatus Hodarchaeota archaeon]
MRNDQADFAFHTPTNKFKDNTQIETRTQKIPVRRYMLGQLISRARNGIKNKKRVSV